MLTFSYYPPFEPPSYRGLCVLLAPPHPLDAPPPMRHRPNIQRTDSERTTQLASPVEYHEPRERSETMSTSSESYVSSGTTEATSPSIGEWEKQSPIQSPPQIHPDIEDNLIESSDSSQDVQMHPCESKKVSLNSTTSSDEQFMPSVTPQTDFDSANAIASSSESSSESDEDIRPSCVLLNALHVQDVFEIPKYGAPGAPRFRQARLPQTINLRNLHVQQIKYATISDVILYGKDGATMGVLDTAEK